MLGLATKNEFYGMIGTETSREVNKETICVGDTISITTKFGQVKGVVVIKAGEIKALINTPDMEVNNQKFEQLDIAKIVRSHRALKKGREIPHWQGLRIKEIKGTKQEKIRLALTDGSTFYGFVGSNTSMELLGHQICVGDTIVGKHKSNRVEGLVAVYNGREVILRNDSGLGFEDTENLIIKRIDKNHKWLKLNDSINNGWNIVVKDSEYIRKYCKEKKKK